MLPARCGAGLGTQLWEMLPEAFRGAFFDLVDRGAQISSIFVHSTDMIFPWELVIPHRAGMAPAAENRLGRRYILGRWQPGKAFRPEPQRMRVERFCVLNPAYTGGRALAAAQEEVQRISQRFPGVTIIRPGTLARVQAELLSRSDSHLFHFSGHGRFDPVNADLSELLLEGADTIDALQFATWSFDMKGGPLVFLNACQVGSAGTVVGRSGGFAATLLARGCSGVIAPYWPVQDTVASNFALALYEKLAGGMVIGQALQEIRRDNLSCPSHTAFAYFGDPFASLDMAALERLIAQGAGAGQGGQGGGGACA